MLSNKLEYINMSNRVDGQMTGESKSSYFQQIFLNWIISVIYGAKFTRFRTCIAEGHSEGTMSQILYSCTSSYFIQSRKLGCKKW